MTHAERVEDGTLSAASQQEASDEFPGFIANPTVPDKSWLSVDRPIRHRGTDIPAHRNLLAVEAIRRSFDGSRSDLLFPQLSPFVIKEVRLLTDAFDLMPGPYVFSLRWESAGAEVFSDTVSVYIDLAR